MKNSELTRSTSDQRRIAIMRDSTIKTIRGVAVTSALMLFAPGQLHAETQNDVLYEINVPVQVESVYGIAPKSGYTPKNIVVNCYIGTKNEVMNDSRVTLSIRDSKLRDGDGRQGIGSQRELTLNGNNSMLGSVKLLLSATYEQRVKNHRDHYACFLTSIVYEGLGGKGLDDKSLRIDRSKSVLKVTGAL